MLWLAVMCDKPTTRIAEVTRRQGYAGLMRLELAATIMPAGDFDVAGDFCMVEAREDGTTMIVVGDVTGHGVEAAARAEVVRPVIAEHARDCELRPCDVLEASNRDLRAAADDEYQLLTTAVAVSVDPADGALAWAYAGHLPPHWLDTGVPLDGAVPGVPLCVHDEVGCSSHGRRNIKPGQGLVIYTDGVEDARGPGRARFGVARVTHALAHMDKPDAQTVVTTLRRDVCAWAEGELDDDVCIVAVRLI